jgi:hypothetical protein
MIVEILHLTKRQIESIESKNCMMYGTLNVQQIVGTRYFAIPCPWNKYYDYELIDFEWSHSAWFKGNQLKIIEL